MAHSQHWGRGWPGVVTVLTAAGKDRRFSTLRCVGSCLRFARRGCFALELASGKAGEALLRTGTTRDFPGWPGANVPGRAAGTGPLPCQAAPGPGAVPVCILTLPGDRQDTGRLAAQCPMCKASLLCVPQYLPPPELLCWGVGSAGLCLSDVRAALRERPGAFCLWFKRPPLTALEGKGRTHNCM